jgi:hypothetical protein
MPNTTTTLNPGSGGDVMDETLVTQSDGVTSAKRPRVVTGGDNGELQTYKTGSGVSRVAADVVDAELIQRLEILTQEQRRTNVIMRMLLMAATGQYPSIEEVDGLTDE